MEPWIQSRQTFNNIAPNNFCKRNILPSPSEADNQDNPHQPQESENAPDKKSAGPTSYCQPTSAIDTEVFVQVQQFHLEDDVDPAAELLLIALLAMFTMLKEHDKRYHYIDPTMTRQTLLP